MKTLVSLGRSRTTPFQKFSFTGSWLLFVALLLLSQSAGTFAAQLKEARVSQVIKDVKLLPGEAAARPATVSDEVRNGTAVRTGVDSRAELTFTDQTLARLGANTIFSFNEGTRNLQLGGGAILLRVPKGAGGAQINTAAVTAAITGTTILLEFHPDAYIKFIILEGTGRIFRNDHIGESVLLHAGQMLIVNPNAKGLPDPVDVDLERLIKTSLLINGFRPLPSDDLIAREIQTQLAAKSGGELLNTNLVIFGRGTTVALLDPTHTSTLDQANANEVRRSHESPTPPFFTPTPRPSITPTPTQTPTATPTITPRPTATPTAAPSKFGALSVIAAVTPYQIKVGTVIKTDPSITTNGKTDFSKIYRNQAQDGPLSRYLFTATSPFDTASRFDLLASAPGLLPIAAFKFSSLNIAGNPTINLANNGATSLALVSVGDITSGAPGGTLTFAGLKFLLLATQNGSITLGSNLSFENIPTLIVDARGATSDLTFDSSVSGTTDFALLAQHDIKVTDSLSVAQSNDAGLKKNGLSITLQAGGNIIVGGNLTLTTDASNVSNGGVIFLGTGGDITIGGAFDLTVFGSAGNIDNGGNINVGALGNITAGSIDFVLDYNNQQVSVTNGSDITLNTQGNLTTTGDNGLTMTILTPIANNLTNGGNLTLAVGGNLTNQAAGGLDLTVVTTVGTQVGQGANLSLGVAGNLLTNTLAARIQNDTSGQIGTGGNLIFNLGGDLHASSGTFEITTTANGNIDRGGSMAISTGGDLTIDGVGTMLIDASNAGHIGIGGNMLVNVTGDFSAGSLSATIDSSNGGAIDQGGSMTFQIGGGFTTSGDASFAIFNAQPSANSTMSLNANSIDIGGSLAAGDDFADLVTSVIISANNDINVGGSAILRNDNGRLTAGGNIAVGGTIEAIDLLSAGESISANSIFSKNVSAGGDVTIDQGSLDVNTLTASGSLRLINAQSISSETTSDDGTPGDIDITVNSIVATGAPPPLFASGNDADPAFNNDNPGNGGNVALNITTGGLSIGDGGDLDEIEANGGKFDFSSVAGGNGGIVNIVTSGGVTLEDSNNGDPAITADSGALADGTSSIARGNGGTVDITAGGEIDVNSTILVSSKDTALVTPTPNPPPALRRSAKGGNISLTSHKTGGIAINVSNTSQLLALLDQAAPGPGGAITILATGANSDVDVKGTVQADRGRIDIRHTGNAGEIYLGGGSPDFLEAHADVVKVGALGSNGILTIGQGSITADNTLKLYANSGNGQINFIENVTIGGGSFTIIAANTVTINNGKTVTVNGAQADVYTGFTGGVPNANYTGSGGNGSTTGAFGGSGASAPQTLPSAPPFDGPPGG